MIHLITCQISVITHLYMQHISFKGAYFSDKNDKILDFCSFAMLAAGVFKASPNNKHWVLSTRSVSDTPPLDFIKYQQKSEGGYFSMFTL